MPLKAVLVLSLIAHSVRKDAVRIGGLGSVLLGSGKCMHFSTVPLVQPIISH